MVSIDYCIHKPLLFKDTWFCDNSRNGIYLAIPGSDGQTKNFFDASFFYHKLHVTLLFCSLNWYRQAFMASETLCLFAFVVHPSPCFHAYSTGGAYHLAKPNSPGKNGWNFMGKWSKRPPQDMYLHSGELNVVSVTENVNTFLLVWTHVSRYGGNWRYCFEVYKVFTVVMYSSQLSNYQLLFLYLTLFIYRLIFYL